MQIHSLAARVVAVGLAATIAGCAAVSVDPAQPTAEVQPTPDVDPLDAAQTALGCTAWALGAEPAPGVDQWGTCVYEGTDVLIYLIPSDEGWSTFLAAASAWGATEGWFARAAPIAAFPQDQSKIEAVRAALG